MYTLGGTPTHSARFTDFFPVFCVTSKIFQISCFFNIPKFLNLEFFLKYQFSILDFQVHMNTWLEIQVHERKRLPIDTRWYIHVRRISDMIAIYGHVGLMHMHPLVLQIPMH